MIDLNSKTIQIGDIVKIEGSPIKSDNAVYVVVQDGTNSFYCGNDLTMYKVAKTDKGYTLSKAQNNIRFYPLVCFSSKYKYSRKELDAATIEIIEQANHARLQVIKSSNDYDTEEGEQDYYDVVVIESERQIADVSYLVKEEEKLTALFSNLTLKNGQTLIILKRSGDRDTYSRHGIPYELRKVEAVDEEMTTKTTSSLFQ